MLQRIWDRVTAAEAMLLGAVIGCSVGAIIGMAGARLAVWVLRG